MPGQRRRRLRHFVVGVLLLAVVGGTLGVFAVATDTLGAGERWQSVLMRVDRFLAGPVPDRATLGTVRITEPPETPSPTPEVTPVPATPEPGATATPTPAPTPTPTPRPKRKPIDYDIVSDPGAVFATQAHKDWCAPAGVQMVLAVLGQVNTSVATQRKIASQVRAWESYADSHNGDWGPAAMALALDAYGAPGYEIRAYESRGRALLDSAIAIQETNSPVILLAWRGAHTWVMTGFRADADPSIFEKVKLEGAYILDPWYPRISSIWGRSDKPGTFQDAAEMQRNFLPWKRPEGQYPDRDGLYITLAPTIPVETAR